MIDVLLAGRVCPFFFFFFKRGAIGEFFFYYVLRLTLPPLQVKITSMSTGSAHAYIYFSHAVRRVLSVGSCGLTA